MRAALPQEIDLGKGVVLKHKVSSIGGLPPLASQVIRQMKRLGGKYRVVEVLPASLKHRNDLHGRPYTPGRWIFTSIPYTDEQ